MTRGAESREGRSKSRKTGSLLAPRGPFLLAFLHGGLSAISRVKRRDASTSARARWTWKSPWFPVSTTDGDISCKRIGFSHLAPWYMLKKNPCAISEHDRQRSSFERPLSCDKPLISSRRCSRAIRASWHFIYLFTCRDIRVSNRNSSFLRNC